MSDIGRDGPEQTGDPASTKQPPARGTAVTLTTVIALLIATGLTILGVGAADNAVANFDASSWLWSSGRGEVDRVNGITARVDTRAKIQDAQNHEIHISQTDRYLLLRDLTTGQISALDLTTLQVSAVMPTTPGLGVMVALAGESAIVIDSVQGQIRQLDPRSLTPIGDSITLPPGIVPGTFDGKGTLWVGVPTEGTVVAIRPGTDGSSPTVQRTITVADPGHDLVLSALDDGVAVLDNTSQSLTIVIGEKATTTPVNLNGIGTMPAYTSGSRVAITVPDNRQVVIVSAGTVRRLDLPGRGPHLPAVVYADRVYVAEPAAGIVHELSLEGRALNEIKIDSRGGTLELEVRENHLFINAPNGSTARVVNDKHEVKEVDKYADGVLGADPPPPPPPAEDPEPPVTVPGRPRAVSASAGDQTVTVTWRPAPSGGSPIIRYVVEGGGQRITVGARQRSVTVEGLVNGETYTFTVHAVNKIGAGPKAKSKPVTPTRDVPDPPTSVTATANPDGSVTVTWPEANGQGRRITSYAVTAITGGEQSPIGSVQGTEMTIASGSLEYGTQYAFTVVTVNDLNANSEPSPVSNTVVPFTVPGAPRNLSAATDPTKPGTIQVSWNAAVDNGRPITEYVVDDGNQQQSVTGTSATLSGYGNDESITVTVHAVNEAGDGPTATATARTMDVPTLTFTSHASGYNDISVTFTPNNRGGNATCRLQVNGAGSAQRACTTQPITLQVTGLWPNRTYQYTITITNPAGSDSYNGSRDTATMRFTVICGDNSYCGTGVWAYVRPSQDNPGDAIAALRPGTTKTPQCYTTGGNVNATPWGGKSSTVWLRYDHSGTTAYFPWAWATLDGGDNYRSLPGC